MVGAGENRGQARDPRVTADALVDLRLNHPLAKGQNLLCPHDRLFWNETGRDLASTAQQLDPVFAPFNIARYRWFTERLQRAAQDMPQILVLGAGFDSRAMALPQLASGKLTVFEVDFADRIVAKLDILARNKVSIPPQLRYIGADLTDPLLRSHLAAAGFRSDLPTLVLMEGAFFYLSRDAAATLLDPQTLGLAPGSSLVFDLWTKARQDSLNAKVEARLGRKLFGESPIDPGADGDCMDATAQYLQQRGYGDIEVLSLERLCVAYGLAAERDPLPQSWLVVEARLPQA
ncbi:MAG TPA: class I SAM-dependent methyltransferase [Terriglobales bacterium]|nr:class I SAM-dependent methyltransferase [Terriglobales bacterium]